MKHKCEYCGKIYECNDLDCNGIPYEFGHCSKDCKKKNTVYIEHWENNILKSVEVRQKIKSEI